MKKHRTTNKKIQTLKEIRPQAYSGLEAIYHAAVKVINDPQYERAAPAPEDETLDTWGIEMLYYGITSGYKLARQDMRKEAISNVSGGANSQTFGDLSVFAEDEAEDENDNKTV